MRGILKISLRAGGYTRECPPLWQTACQEPREKTTMRKAPLKDESVSQGCLPFLYRNGIRVYEMGHRFLFPG